MSDSAQQDAPPRRRRGRRALSIAWKVAAVVIAAGVIFWVHRTGIQNERLLAFVSELGYVGLFVAGFVSGFNVIVPIPAISFLPVITEAGLDRTASVLVISAGMTCGDMVGYLLGRVGRKLVEKPQWLSRLEQLRERHRLAPYVLLFFYASVSPLPNELVVIPMALIGCRWYGVFVAALGGNLIFNSLLAAGFEGIFSIF